MDTSAGSTRSGNRRRWLCKPPVLALLCAIVTTVAGAGIGADGKIEITDKTFGCISKLKAVRGFFVGNLLGDLKGSLAVAHSSTGGTYPPGTVIQLVPTEVMVKQPNGFNPISHDWEFFELTISKQGTQIDKRGFADVVNRFGGNCFGCHIKAQPEWDFVCETTHGCDPLALTPAMSGALQRTDPRCPGAERISASDKAALQALADLLRDPPK